MVQRVHAAGARLVLHCFACEDYWSLAPCPWDLTAESVGQSQVDT